jgi:hypothetical protein
MRRLLRFSALLLTMILFSSPAPAQVGATTSVTANPTTITVGSSVGLAATVQPNSAPGAGKTIPRPSGTITFLDGSTPLSSAPIALAPNGIASATFPQIFGTPDPTLTANDLVGDPSTGELVGDLNGDGVQDLLIYNFVAPFSLQTFTSNGKGGYNTGAVQTLSFAACASGSVAVVPQLIDFNGDGKPDLLCGLQVAYGNGDGTFAQPIPVSFLSSGFVSSFVADLNGDGKTDILGVSTIPVDPAYGQTVQFAITVFLNQGGGSFVSTGTFPVDAPTGGFFVSFFPPSFVDLNGDGKLDVIAQTQEIGATQIAGPLSVNVLLNQGNGTFGTYMPVTVASSANNYYQFPYGMAYGDVNGDGKQDLILTLADSTADLDALVLLGNGDGTFQAPLTLALHTNTDAISIPYYQTPSVVVQDLNLDGKQDLVFSDGLVALGNGDGTFVLSSPLFPLQLFVTQVYYPSFPLVQLTVPGNLVPSLVYLLPTVTPPAASVFTPQTSSSAALSPSTLGVGTHSITARYSGDANYTAGTSAAVPVTVNQAASATAITSTANPSFAGQNVTVTASVTSPGPTPTGNVIFTSGSTTLATVALSGGSASYTTSSFTTVGTQTITASYSGDANTQASSTTLSQVVNAAFTLAPDGGGNTTLTVNAGQTVSAPINVTGAAGFSGQVTFACSGLPANTSCSFSPATINLSGTPAVPTLLTVNTAASTSTSQLRQSGGGGLGAVAYGLGLAGLIIFWPIRRKGSRVWAMLMCTFALAAAGLTSCSAGSGAAPTPATTAGTYNFTVTASSGKVQTQSSYTLVVQ